MTRKVAEQDLPPLSPAVGVMDVCNGRKPDNEKLKSWHVHVPATQTLTLPHLQLLKCSAPHTGPGDLCSAARWDLTHKPPGIVATGTCYFPPTQPEYSPL